MINKTPIHMNGISGTTTTVGTVNVPIEIGGIKGYELFHVVEDTILGNYDLYLGTPFFVANKCSINYDNLSLSNRLFNVPIKVDMLQAHLKSPHSARISSVTVTSNRKGNQSDVQEKNVQSPKINDSSSDVVQSNSKHQGKRRNLNAYNNKRSGDLQEIKNSSVTKDKNCLRSCAIERGMLVERPKGRKRTKRTRGKKTTEKKNETEIIKLKPGSKVFLEQEANQGPPIASGPFIVDEILKDYIILKWIE